MSNILIGWLKDHLGRKIAPRTLAELVQMSDGSSVADRLEEETRTIMVGSCPIQLKRCGKVVTMTCADGTASVTSDGLLFTVPDGFIPYAQLDFPMRTSGGLAISTSGYVIFFGTTSSAFPLRFTITYIAQ